MERNYTQAFLQHFSEHRQMLFVMGPRQSGKTTVAQMLVERHSDYHYFSWDNLNHRDLIVQGPQSIAQHSDLAMLKKAKPIICFDEIHKYLSWRDFLKGFYDTYPEQAHVLVTGSAKLDVFSRGGDSLMGRYFPFRFHPFSVAEIVRSALPAEHVIWPQPKEIDESIFQSLWQFGGYPDPLLKQSKTFHRRWQKLRSEQLVREDIRDLTRVHDLDRLALLMEIMKAHASKQVIFTTLAKQLRVTDKTIRNWLSLLKAVYFCFEIKPYSKNVVRALVKEPKFYLWDWSLCSDDGARAENFIALALLKAVHYWSDLGLGDYELCYLRDKDKREVDFIVIKNGQPWLLIEVKKKNNRRLSPHLHYFQQHLQTDYALQVVIDMPYVDTSCFVDAEPLIVPARTFLSQLV